MEAWLAQHFFNPAFMAGGAALVSAPIIIHFINRLRFKRVRFAAMEFLLQSQQKNRRRILLEHLLLLLLRILIVMALVALIARLILDPNQLSLFQGAKSHHVVVLDDSGSMRDRWGETTAFDEALVVAKKIVAEGSRRPDTQRFSLILLSKPDAALFTQRDVNEAFLSEMEIKLENLKCSHRPLGLEAGFDAAKKLFEEDKAAVKHLHVLSDFRKREWVDQKALSSAIKELDSADISVNLVKTVPESHPNVSITELSGSVQVAVAGIPVRLKVGVKNSSTQLASQVGVSVYIDGQKLPMRIVFEKIEPETEIFREFDVVFDSPRNHKVRVNLENDALSEDDSRFLAVDVRLANPVLVIDGNPQADEAFYVQTALAPDVNVTGFAPLVENVDYLRRHPIDQFQSIYLLNVPELAEDALAELENFVEQGGGLVWFLGDAIKPAYYNAKLYKEGQGLFPVQIASAPKVLFRDEITSSADLEITDHPIFQIFQGQDNPLIETVHVNYFYPVVEDVNATTENTQVNQIANLRNKAPLIFEHRFGAGRVITSLTSAGPIPGADGLDWNDWSRNPSYIVFQLELQKHIARKDRVPDLRIAGDPFLLSLDPAQYLDTVEVISPDSLGDRITRLQAAPSTEPVPKPDKPASGNDETTKEESINLVATFRETDEPGIYTVRTLDQNQNTEEKLIAFNFPQQESSLELTETAELRKQIGTDVQVQIQEPGEFQWIQGKEAGHEIRNALLILLILFLLAEQMLAYKLSYHTQTRRVTA